MQQICSRYAADMQQLMRKMIKNINFSIIFNDFTNTGEEEDELLDFKKHEAKATCLKNSNVSNCKKKAYVLIKIIYPFTMFFRSFLWGFLGGFGSFLRRFNRKLFPRSCSSIIRIIKWQISSDSMTRFHWCFLFGRFSFWSFGLGGGLFSQTCFAFLIIEIDL